MGKLDIDISTGMTVQEERLHEIISEICDTQRQPILSPLALLSWVSNWHATQQEMLEVMRLKDHITQLHILTAIKKILEHDTGRDASVLFSPDLETSERQVRGIGLLRTLLHLKPEYVPIVLGDVQMVSRMEQDHLDLTGLSVLELLHQSGGSKLWNGFVEPLREGEDAGRKKIYQTAMRHVVIKLHEASFNPVLGLRAGMLLQQIRYCDKAVGATVDDVLAAHRRDGKLAKKPEGQAPST